MTDLLSTLEPLKQQLGQVMRRDRDRLEQQIRSLARRLMSDRAASDTHLDRLARAIEASILTRKARHQRSPVTAYDEALPVCQNRARIQQAIEDHQVLIVAGETGSGKTTQIPKICLDAGRGRSGWIGCTQPRRIAARSIAVRLAEELSVTLGEDVGYQVRFEDKVTEQSLIKVMTDGVLLSEIHRDPLWMAYDTLIIDEAHERSLNIDFLLGVLKKVLPLRPDLRVIITSATIDTERFSSHFSQAPIIEVSGRSYPVEVRYHDPEQLPADQSELSHRVARAVRELSDADPLGDILVFLPGERDIREVGEWLDKQRLAHTRVLPLYARLPSSAQQAIFNPGTGRRIILSTNIAETSLTVPGIRFVIDSGLARLSRYSHRSKVLRLPIEPISQASANQRSGRCGRLGPGICIRLYSEVDFASRPEYTEPEILRTSLASVILQMQVMNLGDIESFPFLDPPAHRAIADGFQLLIDLQALDETRSLTEAGREMASLPVDVPMGRLLLGAREHSVLDEGIVLAAVLTVSDPRERPADSRQKADQAHQEFTDERSDFMGLLMLWNAWMDQRSAGRGARKAWCRRHFLNANRMREWVDLVRQLRRWCQERSWPLRDDALRIAMSPDSDALHQALLSAFITQVGHRDESDYEGPRQNRFMLFPGSSLSARPPAWVMSSALIDTGRLYAHLNAAIDPEWIEREGAHLLRQHVFEPWWSEKRATVMAYEQLTLYGLVVVARRPVAYAAHQPAEARELMISEGLVPGRIREPVEFVQHNRALIESISELETRRRKQDLMVDERQLFEFFDQRIPTDVVTWPALKTWLKGQPDDCLKLTRAFLLAMTQHDTRGQFPDALTMQGRRFEIIYTLAPGDVDDGANLIIPISDLNLVDLKVTSWLVPGLLRERVTQLIRSLPKPIRRQVIPVNEMVDAFIASEGLEARSLTEALAMFLSKRTGAELAESDFDESRLEPHLRFNGQLKSEQGALLAQSRDLAELKRGWMEQAREAFVEQAAETALIDDRTRWDFGPLAELARAHQASVHPAVVDQIDAVGLRFFEDAATASAYHIEGIRRLAELTLVEKFRVLRKDIKPDTATALIYSSIDSATSLHEDLVYAVSMDAVRSYPRPVDDSASFDALCDDLKRQLLPIAARLRPLLREVMQALKAVRAEIGTLASASQARVDLSNQLAYLFYPGFLTEVALSRFTHYPRYLKAMQMRIERGRLDPAGDADKQALLEPYMSVYLDHAAESSSGAVDRLHWLLEEYRVSVFAQILKTAEPVSPKRLDRAIAELTG